MKNLLLFFILFCLLSAGCAYTPEGKPEIVCTITQWKIASHPVSPYDGQIEVYYTLNNTGTSDNKKIKKNYIWQISVPIEIIKSNNEVIEKDLNGNYLLMTLTLPDMGTGYSYFWSNFFVPRIFGTNFMQDTNLIFIKEIKAKKAIITLEKIPFL